MKIADLHSFVVVTEAGNLTEAARRLHRTAAAIAASIKRLERQTGQRLVHRRSTSGIEPTPVGHVLLDHARQLLDARDRAVDAIGRLPRAAGSSTAAAIDAAVANVIAEAESSPVYNLARETPLDHAALLSEKLRRRVLLKREDLQPGFSFKIRGAYHCMARLSVDERRRGVVTASAGNHAQGVARAAQHLRVTASIVMPVTTPRIKIAAVERLGATVELIGEDFDAAHAHARQVCDAMHATFIHPFDDLQVIGGQATVGLELARQMAPGRTHVFVPVGGGGLIAGVGSALKHSRSDVRVVGVEPAGAAGLSRSLEQHRTVRLEHVDTFAEGVAVREVGRHSMAIATRVVDDMLTVTNDEICSAICDAFEDRRVMLEPSGAVALAGLIKHASSLPAGEAAVAILSGANLDFEKLLLVAQRGVDVKGMRP